MTFQNLVEYLKQQKIINNNIYQYTWLSGHSTVVAPLELWHDTLVIQLKTDKNYFKKFLTDTQNKFNDVIEYCYFSKSDGSCPSTLRFKLKKQED